MGTKFATVYNRFLDKITDDMYVELTPEDTRKDLQRLLVNAIPEFEFPRKNLYDYEIDVLETTTVFEDDFVIRTEKGVSQVENSSFSDELDHEEINILATLMTKGWLARQILSIENTRQKYSGSDFKFTSQAAHLTALLKLSEEVDKNNIHLQRLYKRRKRDKDGNYISNWSVFRN